MKERHFLEIFSLNFKMYLSLSYKFDKIIRKLAINFMIIVFFQILATKNNLIEFIDRTIDEMKFSYLIIF
jgi:hypothetical protein